MAWKLLTLSDVQAMKTGKELLAAQEARMRAGEITPAELIDFVYDRIEAYPDKAVWIHLRPRAEVRAEAESLGDRTCLPLYGLPFAVKDNIDVAGCPTTAACPMYAYTPERDATVVGWLRAAGALCLGKTNLDQFATGLVGVRSPYGVCRNVFNDRYLSGGSSSGSAVAVAAGLASFSLGTDTAGSGRVPAGFNAIVGLKPTKGWLSTKGVVPACRSLDCVSIFARTIEEASAVASAVHGYDREDAFSREAPVEIPLPSSGERLRFGIPDKSELQFFGNTAAEALYEEAVERCQAAGGEAVVIDFAPFRKTAELLYDGPWVAERTAAVGEFISKNPQAVLPVIQSIVNKGRQFDAVQTFSALYRLEDLKRKSQSVWKHINFLLLPTTGTIYTVDEVLADPLQLNTNLGYYTNFVNLLDLCALAVPSGFQPDGLPVGVTLVAPAWQDGALAVWAKAVQSV
jgi:allophanate hydrolase